RKASAGCSVKMISSDDYYDRVVPTLHVKTLARFRLHAKCVVIDGLRFFVGSQNLRRVSMDARREVGMIAEDAAMAQRIERVFDDDWNNAAEMAAVNELKTT
ncbi:MAG TPA: phospholipase D-like domain-containing protein, partial [Blastocatellia bacterium]|nr:phospholipase D-like domain-containing protein [Blastocatellia bacterium]